jgi:hypothetical protein
VFKLDKLFDFLTELALHPREQLAFHQNLNTLIEKAELSQAEKFLLKSKDKDKIGAAFTDNSTVLAFACGNPGDDPLPDPDDDPPPPPPPPTGS